MAAWELGAAMALFGLGSNKDKPPLRSPDAVVIGAIFEVACAYLNKPPKGIHVEDLISALAAVTGEFCIRAQGEFDVDAHGYAPGSPVLSEAMNRRLSNDASSWAEAPQTTILGFIRHAAVAAGYAADDFPPLDQVYRTFAAGLGKTEWGRMPLSTTEGAPFLPPLQAAHELRGPVRNIFKTHGVAVLEQPILCACALVHALGAVKSAIKPAIAAAIAVDTVNGMAKTAPLTAKHVAELSSPAKS